MRYRSPTTLFVLCATLIGALLRLWNLESAQFRGDDFVVSTFAIDIARQWSLPTGVPSSIGINNGPSAPFLLALPAALSGEHQWLAMFVGILNTAMIPASYLLARDLFGKPAGLFTAVLVAVNPWLVIYGRRLWLNAFLAPTALFFLITLHSALVSGRLRAWALAGVAAALSAQIHLSSIPNLLAMSSVFAFAKQFPASKALAGVVVTTGCLLPWVVLSLVPDLTHFTPSSGEAPTETGVSSIERATIIATGVAYQSIAGQAGQLLDATAPPFTYVDWLARALAVAGFAFLAYVAWRERTRNVAVAATCLVMVAMVAVPTLVLLRPAQAGQLPYLYPYYFINLIPPVLIGMAAVCAALSVRVRPVGVALVSLIAIAQLGLAAPFFLVNEEFWRLGDYGVPWKYTRELVDKTRMLAAEDHAPIMVGGEEVEDSEQASVTARLLKRQHEPTRMFDSRDGIVFRTGEGFVYEVTFNDAHTLTRLLRHDFAPREVFTQVLPGDGWTRRVFRVPVDEIEQWAKDKLQLRATSPQAAGGVIYERAGVVMADPARGGPYLGVHWQFDADPPEPFLTDVIVYEGELEVLRQVHVAYPAAAWQRGDWNQTRMLNLFELPADFQSTAQTSIGFEHRGIITGRRVSPTARLALSPSPVS